MNFIEKLVVAMLVVFGLAMTTSLEAQTFVDRYEAVDNLGANLVALASDHTGDGQLTGPDAAREAVVLNGAYWTLMAEIDDAEDTEAGYLNWETEADAELLARDPNGDALEGLSQLTAAEHLQRLKDHLLELISE